MIDFSVGGPLLEKEFYKFIEKGVCEYVNMYGDHKFNTVIEICVESGKVEISKPE